MTRTLYATVRRLLNITDEPVPQPPRPVRFALDDLQPYTKGRFCEYERDDAGKHQEDADDHDQDAGSEIGLEQFLHRLRTAWNNQVLLYVHGTGKPSTVFQENERLQKQCDQAEPGLVQVVPVIWPSPDRRIRNKGDDPDADAQPAAAGVGNVLRTLLQRRDVRHPAERKRISVLAHGVGARVLRDALASWADDAGPPYGAFRNIFLAAADISQHALEKGRHGRRLSDAARNVTVYYANDDWAFSSLVTRRRNPAVTRRLGQAGPADLSEAAKNVYAVDCDNVYTIGRDGVAVESAESPYFLTGSSDSDTPSPVVTHLLHALRTGRVDADPATQTRVLAPAEGRGDR